MKSTKYSLLDAAYMFYYASATAFKADAEASGALNMRLKQLIEDLLVVANNVSMVLTGSCRF